MEAIQRWEGDVSKMHEEKELTTNTQSTTETLGPCPFCGVVPVIQRHTQEDEMDAGRFLFFVECSNGQCPMALVSTGGPYREAAKAAERWNTRMISPSAHSIARDILDSLNFDCQLPDVQADIEGIASMVQRFRAPASAAPVVGEKERAVQMLSDIEQREVINADTINAHVVIGAVTPKRAMEMFDRDLEILMNDLHGMQSHYNIADWEAFVFLRKAGCPESYVVKYAAINDGFAKQIVALHSGAAAATAAPVESEEE